MSIKKLFIISLCLGAFFGCNQEGNPQEHQQNMERKFIPNGAKVFKSYCANSGMRECSWTKWELDGECFLSYDVGTDDGLLTKINCPSNF